MDETHAAPVPAACPDCGGTVEVTRVASQYQEELPAVRPVVRRFDIEVGHCSQCRRRVQGRHVLPGRGFDDAATVLGTDYAGVLVRDGWVPYRCYDGLHQTCLNQYPDVRIMLMSAQTPPLQAASAPMWSA